MKELSQLTDAALMSRLAKGETSCLGELYTRHYQRVKIAFSRWAPQMNEMDKEDVVQEVFLALNKSAANYEEQSRFIYWLYKIAFRTANGWRRKHWIRLNFSRNRKQPVAAGLEYEMASPEDTTAFRQLTEQLLSELPDDLRTTVWLHHVEELDGNEIAEIMGVERATVYTRLHRIRQLLLTNANYDVWKETLAKEASA